MTGSLPHRQWTWGPELEDDLRALVRLALRADLDRGTDWTTHGLIDPSQRARMAVVARKEGCVCGLAAVPTLLDECDVPVTWRPALSDGQRGRPGQTLGHLEGPARDLLVIERLLLNVLSHLSGIATLTAAYVEKIAPAQAVICDTRKTIPPWRRLAKYAVRCGGGVNHRTGLFDGLLIKDNHIAAWAAAQGHAPDDPTCLPAMIAALRETFGAARRRWPQLGTLPLQVEVDNLDQFRQVLPAGIDLVLCDNFSAAMLAEAVKERDATAPSVLLEASGGITLENVAEIAATGVDRISVGALTHSAPALDLGADWDVSR